VKRIKKARDKDEEVIKVVEEMKKAGVKMLRDEEWQIEEGLVLKEGKVYVPKCYDSMLKGLSKELTLVLSDIRELNRVPSTE